MPTSNCPFCHLLNISTFILNFFLFPYLLSSQLKTHWIGTLSSTVYVLRRAFLSPIVFMLCCCMFTLSLSYLNTNISYMLYLVFCYYYNIVILWEIYFKTTSKNFPSIFNGIFCDVQKDCKYVSIFIVYYS